MKASEAIKDNPLKNFDFSLLVPMFLIVIIGLINLRSATNVASAEAGLYIQQAIYVGIGSIVCIIALLVHYQVIERFAYFFWFLNVVALFLVLVLGSKALGATRWLDLGIIKIQPSEFMKITLIFALAKYFNNTKKSGGYDLKGLLVPAFLTAVPLVLTVAQPDLGTGVMMLIIFGIMALAAKIKTKLIMLVVLIAVPVTWLSYHVVLKPYQKQRILTFLDPTGDPHGTGYNTIQSMIAVGSGQVWGKGYMQGTQTQLNFLPEQHTDFIFSVFNEEHGLFGSLALITLYIFLILGGIRVALETSDTYAAMLAIGLTAVIFTHTLINMLMVLGLAPVVGIPLPFMSYGGSSLLMNMIIVALLTNISNKKFMF
jgi:rod shape determining protein RodA